ncbi:XRE family transcriptional regulator [Kaistia sp. MMO-174]|uniref:XRE family transcriptional regulator n=1 Tax=Kaistia sp. MMO-174 TaxID=3081256 RepID=UPI003017AFC2
MPKVPSITQARVKERVEVIGKSPITLARSVGLERGYINDLMIGRKASIRADKLSLVAQALGCDPDYLTGDQEEVRKPVAETVPRDHSWVEFGGICETEAWRSEAAMRSVTVPEVTPMEVDSRFPGLENRAFLVRGDGMAGEGIYDGMLVAAVKFPGAPQPGSVVVCRRSRAGGREIELSLRLVEAAGDGLVLRASPARAENSFAPISLSRLPTGEKVEIVGIVTRAIKLFLSPAMRPSH